ncbi:alpha/beta hydrolase [Tersicoccus sp. Bi-70]|uniref:alpha/beta hydrolase n=1 Tax=Tersicoccus sp. Bi-70 TaxID=1897634 RepID=UPI000977276B|nr:alpha/beta hydrolase [Tersicoccus sp. Bi-70]OMH36930.1 alpha/beta hydrolase [Tersicoccus sp. Bi-70]
MTPTQSSLVSPSDGTILATYRWPAPVQTRGVVQIAHGMAEHGPRYDRLARALTDAGYQVAASDHRGHGNSAAPENRGDFGEAGFRGLAADIAAFGEQLRAENPDLPLFLVAHSMGSMAAQDVLLDHPDLYDGVVLSGTTAVDVLGQSIASAPPGAPAGLEAFNAGFEPRTGFEWLSRDEAEVDAYVADPLCGFAMSEDAMPQILARGARLADPQELAKLRADLPVLFASGQKDPLSGDGALIELAAQRYRDAGVQDVSVTVYPGARHEIFNETNRDEITADVIGWLDRHV